MSTAAQQKVTARHLARSAYLYVRQSTVRQVFENTESTQRQYGLSQRAEALGWPFALVLSGVTATVPAPGGEVVPVPAPPFVGADLATLVPALVEALAPSA